MPEVIFKTSGSSGEPKTIVRTEDSLQADAAALVRNFPQLWRGAVVTTIPVSHMFGALWRIRAPQLAGCTVEPNTVLSVEELLAAKARYGHYLLVTSPSFLEQILTHTEVVDLKGVLTGLVTSGSALRRETSLAAVEKLGVCPLEIYGSTETGTVAYRYQTEGEICTLVPEVTARADEMGRLVVTSPWAMTASFVMSDAVEFVDARHFRLLGRTDRQAKILEELVSLPSVEAAFAAHAFVSAVRVESTQDRVPRLGALLVLSDVGRAALAKGSHEEIIATLRRDLLPTLGKIRFPRRIRIVRVLPIDARGKVTTTAARQALSAWCREPAVLDWRQTADELTAKFVFPPDCECFRGHFPGFPVLPGVAQLYFLRHYAKQAFLDFPEAGVLRRLKFQKLVLPRVELSLVLKRVKPGSFQFSLTIPSGPSTSGMIESEM